MLLSRLLDLEGVRRRKRISRLDLGAELLSHNRLTRHFCLNQAARMVPIARNIKPLELGIQCLIILHPQ